MKKPTHRNESSEILTIPQAAEQLNLGVNLTRALAIESESLLRIGTCVRVDMPRLMKYVRSECRVD